MAANEFDFYIKKDNTGPHLVVQLQDEVGDPVDITGNSTMSFRMKNVEGGDNKVNAAATAVDVAAGTIKYIWVADDTDTAGEFEGEFRVVLDSGQIITFPNFKFIKIKVGEDAL